MRLADMDAFKNWIDCGHLRNPTELCFSELDVIRMIDKQPTVDAEPVRHGEWIEVGSYDEDGYYDIEYKCTECGRVVWDKQPYCHCGAKMDGGKKE